MRTLIFGDIHGALKALEQLLERAKVSSKDKLIFLGDYVDGWSDSARLIDFLIELDTKYECIFIKGNHDVWCEEWLTTGVANKTWLFHGGKYTVESYKNVDEETKLRHLNFFERMPFFHISDTNNLFIHAGFTSMHGVNREVRKANFTWDRTLWEMALCLNPNLDIESLYYPKRLKLYNEIFIGHTPTTKLQITKPLQAANVWNLDTGAAYKSKLSCLELKTKKYFQSDEVFKLYPNENGRNND